MKTRVRSALWAGATALLVAVASARAADSGVVVEEVVKDSAGLKGGVQPGDLLVSWLLTDSTSGLARARGSIRDPFALAEIEIEQSPRGTVTLIGKRTGKAVTFTLPPGEWRIKARPILSGNQLARYHEALRLFAANQLDAGIARLRESIGALRSRQRSEAAWLLSTVAEALDKARRWDDSRGVYAEAAQVAERGRAPRVVASLRQAEALALQRRSDLAGAEALFREVAQRLEQLAPHSLAHAAALVDVGLVARDRGNLVEAESLLRRSQAIREKLAPDSMALASSFNNLGILARDRGDLDEAEALHARALALREKLAPDSMALAASLNNLGVLASVRGRLDEAETYHNRALEIRNRLAPDGLAAAASLTNLGNVYKDRGDLARAETAYRRTLEIRERLAPASLDVALSLNNLGLVSWHRGDLATAEAQHRRSLEIRERLAPQGLMAADSLINLGNILYDRGDLDEAETYFRRALLIKEKHAPDSMAVAMALSNLGVTFQTKGDLVAAEATLRRALTIQERLAPDSLDLGTSLDGLGDIALERDDVVSAEEYYRRGLVVNEKSAPGGIQVAFSLAGLGRAAEKRSDLDQAESHHQRALEIRSRLSPGTTSQAESLRSLGLLRRRKGDKRAALDHLRRAVEALEAQRGKLGGSEEARSGFAARYADYYRDYIELLLELQQPDLAFEVLERSRARSLLAMLAERDLIFAGDVPAQLEQTRRENDAGYDRTLALIARLNPAGQVAELERLLDRLRALQQRRHEIAEQIRAASPRFAALQYPKPLDLAGARAVLDAGSVLLSYSVGKRETVLFLVRPADEAEPARTGLEVFRLPIAEDQLRDRVAAFRNLCQRRDGSIPEALRTQGRSLFDLLLAPAADALTSARRVLVSPDGPLHTLPFGALIRGKASSRHGSGFFAEWKPLHSVVSATVYGELKRSRASSRSPAGGRVVAFGDPQYPRLSSEPGQVADPTLRSALKRGYALEPLPFSREEVESIATLFGQQASTYLGAEASEERAKALGKDARYVHFACHGLFDGRFPLDSALALSFPERQLEGRDNGLLQAWEIFERVRLDADLVTLSACETGLGKELGGEGLLGLTRAFQYAGARSIVASLWSVSDESTADLMKRFYGYLKAGRTKDEALQAAQIDLIRRPATASARLSHPFHWAAFQLMGDWK